MAATSSNIVTSPTVTFSTLAKLMGPSTPVGQANLLHGHKYPTSGPRRGYQNARAQLVEQLVAGTPFAPNMSNLRPHEKEVVNLMSSFGNAILPQGAVGSRPGRRPHWTLHGVDISVFPDVLLCNKHGSGALKGYFAQDPLARGVGSTMAALIYHFNANVLGDAKTTTALCRVYEVRAGRIHRCGTPTRLLANVRAACQLIVALWPSL